MSRTVVLRITNYRTHCVKYRNFTQFPGVEMLREGTVFPPGNYLKLRYFT